MKSCEISSPEGSSLLLLLLVLLVLLVLVVLVPWRWLGAPPRGSASHGADHVQDRCCPKTWGSFARCAVHQYTHRAVVFCCIFAQMWVSVPWQHTSFTN